ncbi:MAG: DUF1353 domain-containing protein [Lentisphaeria bacterium]|nr:DUF1353 domain-containing protein [Lentisphaeria bacterium]
MSIKVEIHHTDARGDFARTLFPQKFKFRGKTVGVPRGFEFDGASVPRLFRPAVGSPLDPEMARAGCTHDFIYRTQPEGWTRAEADLMFLCFLLEDGLPVRKALKAYLAVRAFGWVAWGDHRARLAIEREAAGK